LSSIAIALYSSPDTWQDDHATEIEIDF